MHWLMALANFAMLHFHTVVPALHLPNANHAIRKIFQLSMGNVVVLKGIIHSMIHQERPVHVITILTSTIIRAVHAQ